MGAGPITFNYPVWVARFPEFAGVSEPLVELYAAEASLLIGNSANSPVNDPNLLTVLLNLATAHVAALNSPQVNGQYSDGSGSVPGPTLVGRIANATEGSVSVTAEMPEQPPNAAWWQQTKYGAQIWQMMKPFRLFRYIAPRRRIFNPPGRYWGRVGGW